MTLTYHQRNSFFGCLILGFPVYLYKKQKQTKTGADPELDSPLGTTDLLFFYFKAKEQDLEGCCLVPELASYSLHPTLHFSSGSHWKRSLALGIGKHQHFLKNATSCVQSFPLVRLETTDWEAELWFLPLSLHFLGYLQPSG